VIGRTAKLQVLAFVLVSLLGVSYVGIRYVGLGDRLFGTGSDSGLPRSRAR
jgi:phospholipid/cholesterol/gamma-HCH transport system substrate-binding protein